jgi:protease-4
VLAHWVPFRDSVLPAPGFLSAFGYGLVDEVLTRDAMRARIRDSIGGRAAHAAMRTTSAKSAIEDYVTRGSQGASARRRRATVAVIVASGTILDGTTAPGSIGGDSLAELIRQAEDRRVGQGARAARSTRAAGSAFASDVISTSSWRFRARSGRSSCRWAASPPRAGTGSRWRPTKFWASPTTLTGSIGVGADSTFERLLDKVGVHVDGSVPRRSRARSTRCSRC